MEPVLKAGDYVLASLLPYLFKSPQINDIVVFRLENKKYIKRIKNINKSKYFVYGDNENDSLDSRKFGFIEKKQILGKLIYKL